MVKRTDRAFVARGVEEGEGRTTASRYDAADIWREVWAVLKEIGVDLGGGWIRRERRIRSGRR